MIHSTKEEIIKKHGNNFKSRVWYIGKTDYILYENQKQINWNNVHKITILFEEPKNYYKNGECRKRDGVSYFIWGGQKKK